MPIIAAIDIGSNAIRLAIGLVDQRGSLTLVEDFREPVRLGKDVFSIGTLSEESIARTIEALRRLKKISEDHKVERLRCVATSAMRDARNGKQLIDLVKERCAVEIEVISGEEEARLVFLAVGSKLDLKGKTALLVDIGGGSIEITLVAGQEIVRSTSYPLGSVRLLETVKSDKGDPKATRKLLEKHIAALGVELERELGDRYVDTLVGTGGTLEALGELRVNFLHKKRSSLIRRLELEALLKEIKSLSYEQRMTQLNLKPDRADTIEPACMVLEQIFRHTGEHELLIPNVGLKEGVLLDMLSGTKPGRTTLHARRHELVTFAFEMGKKYQLGEKHAQTVSRLALELFEQIQDLHQLDGDCKLLLELAAILHDVGQFISLKGHHKHSFYLIQAESLIGLSKEQKLLVALVARYHRRAHPSTAHLEFMALREDEREKVRKLAAILRVADALDREHTSNVKSLKARRKNGELRLEVKGKGEMLLERWALTDKSTLFHEVFGMKVLIEE